MRVQPMPCALQSIAFSAPLYIIHTSPCYRTSLTDRNVSLQSWWHHPKVIPGKYNSTSLFLSISQIFHHFCIVTCSLHLLDRYWSVRYLVTLYRIPSTKVFFLLVRRFLHIYCVYKNVICETSLFKALFWSFVSVCRLTRPIDSAAPSADICHSRASRRALLLFRSWERTHRPDSYEILTMSTVTSALQWSP